MRLSTPPLQVGLLERDMCRKGNLAGERPPVRRPLPGQLLSAEGPGFLPLSRCHVGGGLVRGLTGPLSFTARDWQGLHAG